MEREQLNTLFLHFAHPLEVSKTGHGAASFIALCCCFSTLFFLLILHDLILSVLSIERRSEGEIAKDQ